MSTHSSGAAAAPRLDPARAKTLVQSATALAVIGIVLCIAAGVADPKRFAFSYLTGFMFVTTLALGGLFFVMLQHVTRAGWSVAPRRAMEWLGGFLPFTVLLFIPVAFFVPTLYAGWIHPDTHAIGYDMIAKKLGYLNVPFFFARAALYFAVWTFLGSWFLRKSLEQDRSGDPAITTRMQAFSNPAMYLFAFSLTFAAFDWIMSLAPVWYSTIFGVYVFAGATTAALSALALITIAIQLAGLGGEVSTVEHRHDIGKLLFGFIVFWAYIAFSQFFLIWYANIPEETFWFHLRWFTHAGAHNSWMPVSVAIIFGHFWIPFFLLLSRWPKRSYFGLALGAIIMLVMHYVDMYWMIMPTLDSELHVSWIDLAGLLGPLGLLALWLAYRASRDALYPLNDPRLPEAVQLVNL